MMNDSKMGTPVVKRRIPCRLLLASWMAVASVAGAGAQTVHAAHPGFEVATVKPSAPDSRDSSFNFRPGHFVVRNLSLRSVIQFAYDLPSSSDDSVTGGPGWVRSATFDIDAKEDDALAASLERMTPEERSHSLRPMIQALLADRFSLRVHDETKIVPVMVMVAGKTGPKLKRSSGVDGSGAAGSQEWRGLHNSAPGEIEGRDVTLDILAANLGYQPELGGRAVINKTEMAGKYDFTLRWTPEAGGGVSPEKKDVDAAGPSLFTAVQEQLGLKLEARKEPVKVLVIDHVERPSEN